MDHGQGGLREYLHTCSIEMADALREARVPTIDDEPVRRTHPADRLDVFTPEMLRRRMVTMLTRRLAVIRARIARIDAGHLIACADCGTPLTEERIRTIPETERCVSCQGAQEQQRRPLRSPFVSERA